MYINNERKANQATLYPQPRTISQLKQDVLFTNGQVLIALISKSRVKCQQTTVLLY